MKVLFNATTLVMGGALQVAVSFIRQSIIGSTDIDWHYAISKEVFRELNEDEILKLSSCVTIFDTSPAKSKAQRSVLLTLENNNDFDAVFTLFGPAYVRFSIPHVCGVADGWVTHSNLLAFKSLGSFSLSLKMLLTMVYKAFWYRKSTSWIVEANNAKLGLIKRLRVKPGAIDVIQNTCGLHYLANDVEIPNMKNINTIRILCMSAYYSHKNLEIIPEIARYLYNQNNHYEFEFVLTLPKDSAGYLKILNKAKSLGVDKCICNIGPVLVNDGPAVYEGCHIVFLPSFLETFSANYPEAMAMNRPIVTCDLEHAHNACQDAALYFEPTSAKSAA
ncbi:MAG: glycosyltransferase, partial [Pseudomonadota bacterium]